MITKFGESYSERVFLKPLRVDHGWYDPDSRGNWRERSSSYQGDKNITHVTLERSSCANKAHKVWRKAALNGCKWRCCSIKEIDIQAS